jgi:hypothetical protein
MKETMDDIPSHQSGTSREWTGRFSHARIESRSG